MKNPGGFVGANAANAGNWKSGPGTSPSGRYTNDPRMELSRLLDELEQVRLKAGGISPDVQLQDVELQRKIQQATLDPALAGVSGDFGSRGLSGSSLEAIKRTIAAGQIGLQSQQYMNQQAQQSAYSRANFELGKNKQLFDALIGSMQATTTPGAPGTKTEKKGHWYDPIISGASAAIGYTVGGPPGAAAGYQIGKGATGQGSTYQSPYENVG